MIHKIPIRDLNTFGNQLPQNDPTRKDIHTAVIEAIEAKVSYIFLDDEIPLDKCILKGIATSKILERESNKGKRNTTNLKPYVSVQEYILRKGNKNVINNYNS